MWRQCLFQSRKGGDVTGRKGSTVGVGATGPSGICNDLPPGQLGTPTVGGASNCRHFLQTGNPVLWGLLSPVAPRSLEFLRHRPRRVVRTCVSNAPTPFSAPRTQVGRGQGRSHVALNWQRTKGQVFWDRALSFPCPPVGRYIICLIHEAGAFALPWH